MELVTADTLELASQRAYTAFRRIGRVKEYQADSFVKGKIYIDGWPAQVQVEWLPYRNGAQVRLDIAATSDDELNRAADEAMYKFVAEFKNVNQDNLLKPSKTSATVIFAIASALLLLAAAAAFLLHLPPFNG